MRTVLPERSPRDWYREIKSVFRGKNAALGGEPDPAESAWTPPTEVGAIKRFGLSLVWLPDDHHGLIAH